MALPPTKAHSGIPGLVLAGVCLATLFVGLGQVRLWEPDEPRFAEATRQMLERGDLLTPWFNEQPRFEKPILFYWLQLPFVAALGPTEVAVRLPAALAGLGCVLLTYLIGVRLLGERAAWLGALVLATLFRFATYARQGLTDVPALLFELVALHGFLRSHQDGGVGRASLLAWAAIGLAGATKGPVAAIPIAIWVAFLVLARDWRGLRHMRIVAGALVAVAIAAPWYIYMIATHGQAFLDVALGSEVVSRVGGALGPRRGALYYFNVWPVDMLPWTPFFLLALVFLAFARGQLDSLQRRAVVLLVAWFAVVIGAFSLSAGKLPHYLLPAYPAGALLSGWLIDRASTDGVARRLWWVGAMLVVITLTAAAVLVWALLLRSTGPTMAPAAFVLPLLLATGAMVTAALALRRGPVAASTAIAVTVACAVAHASLVVIPRLEGLQPIPPLGEVIESTATPHDLVGHYGTYGAPGLVFYSRHRVNALASQDEVARFLGAPGRAFCVLPGRDAEAVATLAPGAVHEIARRPKLVVRFNRLFGQRPPYDDPLVLVSNRPGHEADGRSPARNRPLETPK